MVEALQKTVLPLGWLRRMVKVAKLNPLRPSTTEMSLTESMGNGSSLTMVAVPCERLMGAPAALVRFKRKISLASLSQSPTTATGTVRFVTPGAKTSTPEALM